MSDSVFAAARKNLSFFVPLGLQRRFDSAERQTIHNVGFSQPAFARDPNAELQVLQSLRAMRVRIDHALDAFLFSQRPPSPIEIEPLRCCVEFHPDSSRARGLKHVPTIDHLNLAV